MNSLSIPLLIIAAISFYEGLNYRYIFSFFKKRKEFLIFSLVCFSFSFYSICDFQIYNSHSLTEAIRWQKYLLAMVPVEAILLTQFVYAIVGRAKDRFWYLIVGIFVPFIVLPLLWPQLFVSSTRYTQKSYSLWKLTARFVEGEALFLSNYLVAVLGVAFIFFFILLFRHYRKYRTSESFVMMICCGCFFLAGIIDGLIALRILSIPCIGEYAFLGMIVAMNRTLLQQFFALHNKISLLNVSLEDQVKRRTDELQIVNSDLQGKIGELALAKKGLEESNLYVENIVNSIPDVLIVCDIDGKVTKINTVARELLHQSLPPSEHADRDGVIGQNIACFFPTNKLFEDYPSNILLEGNQKSNIELCIAGPGDTNNFFSASTSVVMDSDQRNLGTVIILRDISRLKEMENSLRYLATHDILTELPNRLLFQDRAKQAFLRAQRVKNYVSIQLIDFDHFKEINDTLGHSVGDNLLKEASIRIRKCIREYDTVARMGGDEFVVLLSDLQGKEESSMVAQRILDAFTEPFMIKEKRIIFTPSIGISLYAIDGDSIETLLKTADIAMYSAKSSGGNRYCYFSDEMVKNMEAHVNIKEELQHAIDTDELILYYQPLIDTMSGQVVAAEALLRWEHPRLGIMPPIQFIPIAEKTGKIIALGKWVLVKACTQCKEWHTQGFSIPVTVNVSACQIEDAGFVDSIAEVLATTGLPAENLIIEITETAAMYNEAFSISVLENVHTMGVRIYIDDFGSGYSSFMRLKKLPISALKIDHFLTQHIIEDPADAAIIKTIVAMAYTMGLKVIVEGVETEEQLRFIKNLSWKFDGELKCDQVQGYFFSRPVPILQLYRILNESKPLTNVS